MKASVGPTAEMLTYGEAISPSRHLSPLQFKDYAAKVNVAQSSDDNGWIGPLGFYSDHPSAGSLYGYGVPADHPQY